MCNNYDICVSFGTGWSDKCEECKECKVLYNADYVKCKKLTTELLLSMGDLDCNPITKKDLDKDLNLKKEKINYKEIEDLCIELINENKEEHVVRMLASEAIVKLGKKKPFADKKAKSITEKLFMKLK